MSTMFTANKYLPESAITSNKLAPGAVTEDKIFDGAVTTNKLLAGSVTTEKIDFGVLRTNMVADPSFEDDYVMTVFDPFGAWAGLGWTQGNFDQWRRGQAPNGGSVSKIRIFGRSRSGSSALSIFAVAGQEASAISNSIPVEVGKTYRVLIHAAALGGTASMSVSVPSAYSRGITTLEYSETLTGDVPSWSNIDPVTEPVQTEDWAIRAWTFTAERPWVAIRIVNFWPNTDSTLLIDDVSLVEVGIGGAMELTPAGLRLFDDDGFEVGAFVSNRPNYFSVSQGGSTKMSISPEGDVTTGNLTVNGSLTVDGDDLLGNLHNYTPAIGTGALLGGHLDKLPRGIAAYGQISSGVTWNNTEEVFKMSFLAEPGRSYRVTIPGFLCKIGQVNRSTGITYGFRTPTAPGGSTLGGNSGMGWSYAVTPNVDYYATVAPASFVLRCNQAGTGVGGELNDGRNEIFITTNANATATLNIWSFGRALSVVVEDIGLDFPNSGVYTYTGSGGTGGGTATQTYTTTWLASDSRTYDTDNGQTSPQPTDIVHGPWPGGNGDNRYGIIIFGNSSSSTASSQVGVSLATALTGATINKVEVYLYANHWYYSSGGTAYIRPGTHTSIPTTGTQKTNSLKTVTGWPKPGAKWVDITTQAMTLSSGTGIRSIIIGNTGTTSLTTYGRFNGATQSYKPQLRITYTK